eukprot:1140552-Rhodomonas_salina.1
MVDFAFSHRLFCLDDRCERVSEFATPATAVRLQAIDGVEVRAWTDVSRDDDDDVVVVKKSGAMRERKAHAHATCGVCLRQHVRVCVELVAES